MCAMRSGSPSASWKNLPGPKTSASHFAIENLIHNAIKYTQNGGEVTVGISEAKGTMTLTVHDSGVGIAPTDQARLFERFFRGANATHMSPDGSGLGLYIAKTIVEGHGGTIAVASQEGHGT